MSIQLMKFYFNTFKKLVLATASMLQCQATPKSSTSASGESSLIEVE
jgi:hypothetical protein